MSRRSVQQHELLGMEFGVMSLCALLFYIVANGVFIAMLSNRGDKVTV